MNDALDEMNALQAQNDELRTELLASSEMLGASEALRVETLEELRRVAAENRDLRAERDALEYPMRLQPVPAPASPSSTDG